MNIKVIFDSKSIGNGFSIGWGISFLVDNYVLFDTGEKSVYLLNNLKKMNINIFSIKAVVISHEHWDHTGGLWGLLKIRKGLRVYACPHFTQEFKERVKELQGEFVETEGLTKIRKNIFLTGEIPGKYNGQYMPEQSLIAKTERGISVITGCCHPGIIKILEKVRERFSGENLHLIFGGFHLRNSEKILIKNIIERFLEMKIEKVGLTHCSGREAEEMFKEHYRENYISIKAGLTVEA